MQKYLLANKRLREVMRICTLQLLLAMIVCGISLAHPNYAQQVLNREVTISLTEVTIEKALLEIEVVAKVKFVYSHERLKLDETISLKAEKKKLGDLLADLFTPRGIEFTGNDESNFVVLKPSKNKDSEKSGKKTSDARDELRAKELEVIYATVTGAVTDGSTNLPMPGVNVIVKGTSNGTSTDSEGRYSISANEQDVLVFSFIGFTTQELQISGRSIIDVVLAEDAARLSEVIIKAGYWDVKDKERTGNISRVTSKEISKQPVSNPLAALIGRMPGVMITQQSGVPGAGFTIQIRGQNSLRNTSTDNGNLPLYIVNGVPFTSNSLSDVNSGGQIIREANPLNSISPNDIESIEVLKDADATAIYGSRGANGVVLITTKKGATGKTQINLNAYQGIGRVTRKMDLLNTRQYVEMRKEAYRNDGASIPTSNLDLMTWDTTRFTNWQDKFIGGSSRITNLQFSVSGGKDNTQFLVGGGFYKEGTVFPGDFNDRKISGLANITHTTDNNKFRIDFTVNYLTETNNLPMVDLTNQALQLPPNAPDPYDENGKLAWSAETWGNWANGNPLVGISKKYRGRTNRLTSNAIFSYEILKGLNLKTNLGFTNIDLDEISTTPISSVNPNLGPNITGSATFSNNTINTWIVEPHMEYQRTIGSGKFTALLGTTFQENLQESQSILGYGFRSDALIENIKAAPFIAINNADYSQYKYNALFARLHYNFKEKYFLNLTGRRDGSSRFGKDSQFSNFGAFGAAWIFSNEKAIQNLFPVLSYGKIRTSYGVTGSDQIPNYGYLDSYSATTYAYNGIPGLIPTRVPNPDFSWEKTNKFELGLDFGLFNDRIYLSSSWYHNQSSNQLVGYPLSVVSGFPSVQYNLPATVRNTGFEFELNTINLKTERLVWSTNLNLTIPTNKLISYPNIEGSSYASVYVVGKPLSVTQGYHFIKIDQQTGLSTFEDVDGNGSGTDYPTDWQLGRNLTQRYYGAVQSSFTFGGFTLDFSFQYVKQTGRSYIYYFRAPGAQANQPTFVLNRWQREGDVTDIQRFSRGLGDAGASYNALQSSDRSITDASFIRLKNIYLSYKLPMRWIAPANLSHVNLYIQGQNLFTLTNYEGMDPESQNIATLPPLRVTTVGIQITL